MKPLLEKVPKGDYSFYIKEEVLPYFVFPWHNHKEVEIIYVEKGSGTRFVGDHIDNFNDGDLVILGSFLPHKWKSDDKYYQEKGHTCVAKVIHFTEDAFGADFFGLPEMNNIRRMLSDAKYGLLPKSDLKNKIIELMNQMLNEKSKNKIGLLISILEEIAQSKKYQILSSKGFVDAVNNKDNVRLNKVIEYIMNNFRSVIEFKNIADIANMHEVTFSKYFKKHTGKTFTEYITELRIGYACKLLISGNYSISQIAAESGFNNISNFNLQFKKLTRKTPRQYINSH